LWLGMVVRNGGAWHDRQQHDVPSLEELFPAPAHLQTTFVVAEPIAMSQGEEAARAREWSVFRRCGIGLDTISRRSARQGGLQESGENAGDLLQREVGTSLRVERYAGVHELARGVLEESPDVRLDATEGVVEPRRDAIVGELLSSRRRQLQAPGRF